LGDFLDVLCEFRTHVGNIGIHDGPKTLHPRRHKTPNVAKFGPKRIRVGVEEPRGDLADLAFTVHKSRSQSWGTVSLSYKIGEVYDLAL
jgi:hypothetical protein